MTQRNLSGKDIIRGQFANATRCRSGTPGGEARGKVGSPFADRDTSLDSLFVGSVAFVTLEVAQQQLFNMPTPDET